MEIHKGTSRVAVVGEQYTFKVTKVNLMIFTKVFKIINHSRKIGLNFKETKQRLANDFKYAFDANLHNIQSNLSEYNLSKKYPQIVMNTKKSVFGIINIQETGKIISNEENDLLWKLMIDYSTDHNNIVREGHTFYEGGNFARDKDGKIKLIDAGSYTMENTLKLEHENISKALLGI